MINLLSDSEKKHMTKESLVDLEFKILMELSYDFNFPGPMESVERFLRVLEYDHKKIIYDMSYQICKFALTESKFMNYRFSQIAAASVILSINIHEKEQFVKKCLKKKEKNSNFFGVNTEELEVIMTSEEGQCDKKIFLNTQIWSNFRVIS
mmetsp:Transcript_15895/g.24495  ORF Transcript_15895/g.24495 Transcript_15895/m.24495 type:complete len:151 (-) Transcript_15895:159-611(-)|eukprot:CAMPEP_0170482060 /NCGR_PEP_ID=MMETSP0208-20121228/2244_1 /TAXON_ID=197538 /ORGANISM="Strombidium inclinatum, Strain S3" /LENGTH=150 /DNA_ID=CAMNT_0010754857 /DNA_START=1548 /DNA_END=2000 /DNA_ORIENTATION=+